MRIYIGSDHAGFHLKDTLKTYIQQNIESELIDLGAFSEESVDYPEIAREVAEKVVENPDSFGILICGTGIGMCIAANKHRGIRAVDATSEHMAEMSRKHNNANVLCLGGRMLQPEMAQQIVKTFLTTSFEAEERHQRRIDKLEK